jgi:hypothetical protein
MKRLLIALVLVAAPSFAAGTTYTVEPPVSGSACPKVNDSVTNPCFYVVLGPFTDSYQFSVPADATYTFTVSGNYWHRCTVSGRAHQCYTESLTVTNAVVVDAAGDVVLALVADAGGVWGRRGRPAPW